MSNRKRFEEACSKRAQANEDIELLMEELLQFEETYQVELSARETERDDAVIALEETELEVEDLKEEIALLKDGDIAEKLSQALFTVAELKKENKKLSEELEAVSAQLDYIRNSGNANNIDPTN
jgi:cell division protein FtsB